MQAAQAPPDTPIASQGLRRTDLHSSPPKNRRTINLLPYAVRIT
jgi:hypothetical protein